jgi:DNA-binding PadR family transcriptional regulator
VRESVTGLDYIVVSVYIVDMPPSRPVYLGEFEHLVLLAVIRLGAEAYAPSILQTLKENAGRTVTRGALYTTLDRLEHKELLRWRVDVGDAGRGHLPRRAYSLTPAGLRSIRASHQTMARMARGLHALLESPSS